MRRQRTWYVVMNAHKARILKDLPEPRTPAPEEVTMEGPQRKLRDVLPDKPTRSFASAGGGQRSAVEPGTAPLEQDMRRFLGEVAEYLEREHKAKSFDRLVFIGPDEVVGLWRVTSPDALRSCVAHEYRKNLVGLPPEDLAAAVRKLVAI